MAVSINQEKIKDLLLAKGDKLALAVGGGVAALLLVWGVVSAASAPSPSATIKELADGASRVNSGVNSPGEDAAALPKWVGATADFKTIDPVQFAGVGKPFEPVFTPNTLAENPQVLGLTLSQLDVVRLPYKAYDIRDNDDGSRWIGVLKDKKPDNKDLTSLMKSMGDVTRQVSGRTPPGRNTNPRPPQPPPGFPPGGAPPGMGGGGPPPGMPGMGGQGMGGGGRGMGGSMGGMGGPGMGEGGGMMGGAGARTDATVEYVPADEVAKGNLVVAQSVAPLRAVMVHGLIPLREQRLEYQRALKVPPKFDLRTGEPILTDIPPVEYAGFDVQRRVTPPNGPTSDWTDYDHTERFYTEVRARAYGFTVEQGLLSKFVRYNEPLAHPLPVVADDLYVYPKLRMKPIDDAIEKMRQAGIQPTPPSDWEKRLGKPDDKNANPFDPRSGMGGADFGGGMGYGGSMGGPGMGEGGMMGRGGSGGRMPPGAGGLGGMSGGPPPGMPGSPGGGYGGPGGRMPPGAGGGGMGSPDGGMGGPGGGKLGGGKPGMGGGMGSPDGGMGGPGGGLGGQAFAQPETDHLLLRFLDIDVQPGFTYQYRVRLKLKNPNYGKKTGVARKADTTQETIDGLWVQLPDQITLPAESQLYAIDPQKYQDDFQKFYEGHGKEYALKRLAEVEALDAGRRAVVQVQQWQPTVRIDGTQKREPIGTWVVADLPVAPGEYVGKRTLVELPLWSAGLMNYVLREMAGGVKVAGIKNAQFQPKGWPINFRTPSVLVDFDGGRQVQRVGDREIRDDAAQELLIVRPDGKLVVRNSADDMEDKTRKDRNDLWTAWLTRVKTRAAPSAGPGGDGGSGKPGGGGFSRP